MLKVLYQPKKGSEHDQSPRPTGPSSRPSPEAIITNLFSERKLRKELQVAQYFLERYPESLLRMESVARCLYWLGDSKARDHLLRVARRAEARPLYHPGMAGKYYRLSGEPAKARQHFEEAYRQLEVSLDQLDSMGVSSMMEFGFHLNRYQDVESLAERLGTLEGAHQREGQIVAQLARARLTKDAEEASLAAEKLRDIITKDRTITPSATGGFDYLAWYEVALQTTAALEG